jgi:O-acetyl-ADP-ribose deacetylase (regulator of RNase III)
VFPESSQILPCFLVDEVAIPAAVDKLREGILVLQERWPDRGKTEMIAATIGNGYEEGKDEIELNSTAKHEQPCMERASDVAPARWRRRERSEQDRPLASCEEGQATTCEEEREELPYNGDIQAAIRAQDRPAVMVLLTRRDTSSTTCAAERREVRELSQASAEASSEKNVGRRWGSKASTFAEDGTHPSVGETKNLESSGSGSVIERGGDILKAHEEYIVHQCNCVIAGKALGLAEAIFAEYPAADVYKERIERRRPHDVPGTLSVHGRVINFYAQLLPGKPADDAPPGGWPGANRYVNAAEAAKDTREARFRWFENCLSMLHRALPENAIPSIAFPARIGCGLAGGKWQRYLKSLMQFAKANPMWRIAVYDNEVTPGAVLSEPSGVRREVSSGMVMKNASVLTSTGHFWETAVFEALRDGAWQSYCGTEQESLRKLLRSCDDCDEALIDAQRNASLAALAEAGIFPSSFGSSHASAGNVAKSGAAGNLEVRLQRDTGTVAVTLAPIATRGGLGEERSQASDARTTPCPVRLRLPAVGEGELRLPVDLDDQCAPAPAQCGRIIQGTAEMESLGKANGHCGICIEEFSGKGDATSVSRVIQLTCGHPFHEACLTRWFEERRRCPTCKRRFGHIVGNQPAIGTMSWKLVSDVRLAGFRDHFTIMLQFRFPPGKDAAGQQYRGRSQSAYLPHDEGGKLVLELFKLAFRRRVLFDLRVSSSEDKYWPAFNIHLKTATSGGAQRFGYPDDGYYQRVMEELRENGLTVADVI